VKAQTKDEYERPIQISELLGKVQVQVGLDEAEGSSQERSAPFVHRQPQSHSKTPSLPHQERHRSATNAIGGGEF